VRPSGGDRQEIASRTRPVKVPAGRKRYEGPLADATAGRPIPDPATGEGGRRVSDRRAGGRTRLRADGPDPVQRVGAGGPARPQCSSELDAEFDTARIRSTRRRRMLRSWM
jgi:hypothetical protein